MVYALSPVPQSRTSERQEWTSKAVEVVDGLSQEAEVTLSPTAAK